MTRVKICGITCREDALRAVAAGAWALGFVFHKKSPRYIGPYKARAIIRALPPFVTAVGVFVDQKEGAVKDIIDFCRLGTVQFHGAETPQYCRRFPGVKVIKAFRVGAGFDPDQVRSYPTAAYLFDTHVEGVPGGTGVPFDWKRIRRVKDFGRPIILAGGLTALNVGEAVERLRPYAVDVSSGVESAPGRKDPRKLAALFDRLRAAEGSTTI